MKPRFALTIALMLSLAPQAALWGQNTTPAPATSTQSKGWNVTNFHRPSDKELKQKLTPEQYQVTQHEGTEAPFRNAYWDNHEAGIYVDVVSGEPLFSSVDKYDSGTGWPSFTKPLEPANIQTRTDISFSPPGPRSARPTPTRTWVTSSTTAPSRPACATA